MKYLLTAVLMGLLAACGNNSGNNNSKPVASSEMPETVDTQDMARTSAPEPVPTLTCQLNGREWKGANVYNGHLYYVQGIKGMYGGKPYMVLSFKAATAPDNRQLTISFYNFQGKAGVYAKDAVEVLLSGAASGEAQKSELQGHKVPGQNTNFTVAITAWKPNGSNEAIISGKLSGLLKGVLGSSNVEIENGQFTDVAVKIFNDKQ